MSTFYVVGFVLWNFVLWDFVLWDSVGFVRRSNVVDVSCDGKLGKADVDNWIV